MYRRVVQNLKNRSRQLSVSRRGYIHFRRIESNAPKMKGKLLLPLFLSLGYVLAHEEDVHTVQYTSDNFAEEVAKKNHFVMFYAPWCGHCKRFAPTWEELAEMLNQEESNIRIAKVDCTTDGDVCNENEVTGYPTLKFFKVGESESVKFRGSRDLPSLTAFINEQTSSGDGEDAVKIPESGGLTELTEDTFDRHIAEGKHFVKFYAPWCGHCQKLAPVWDKVSVAFQTNGDVKLAKIDCTQHHNVCNQFDIKGYPTLLWIEDGKKIEKYQGARGFEDLVRYVSGRLDMKGPTDKAGDKEDETSSVLVLSGDDFETGIEKGVSFVKFFAPWCGHCKRLAPTWEELGKKYVGHPDVNIIKIDCTLEANKQLCSAQEVEGFPTVYLYKDGKKISEYNGNRSLKDLHDFVEQHLSQSHDEL